MEDVPREIQRALEELRARVDQLEAREEIARLIASYGPSVDSGSSVATAQLWEVDGSYAFSMGAELAVLEGRAEIEAMVLGEGHQAIIAGGAAHVLGPARIALAGDRATATCYSMLVRYDASSGQHVVDRVGANRWVLGRGADGWRVIERVNHLLDGRDEARALLRLSSSPTDQPRSPSVSDQSA